MTYSRGKGNSRKVYVESNLGCAVQVSFPNHQDICETIPAEVGEQKKGEGPRIPALTNPDDSLYLRLLGSSLPELFDK